MPAMGALLWDSTKQAIRLPALAKVGSSCAMDVLVSTGSMAFGIVVDGCTFEGTRHIVRPCVRLLSTSGECQYYALWKSPLVARTQRIEDDLLKTGPFAAIHLGADGAASNDTTALLRMHEARDAAAAVGNRVFRSRMNCGSHRTQLIIGKVHVVGPKSHIVTSMAKRI